MMCDCECHDDEIWGYRLVMGNQYEGLSLRQVIYDKDNGKIIGWNPEPLHRPVSSVGDVRELLVHEMHELDDMLEATKEPILDESKLEKELK